MKRVTSLLIAISFVILFSHVVLAQQSPSQNKKALQKYFTSYTVNKLEWELLQFNLLWQGAFADETYLTSFPVVFDSTTNTFRAFFNVHERRDPQDKSFFSLPRPERESILNGAIESLSNMLGTSFPEIKTLPSLLYIEFKFRSKGGSLSNVAVYKNGNLIINE